MLDWTGNGITEGKHYRIAPPGRRLCSSEQKGVSVKLSVVMPIYNEVHTLSKILDRVRAVALDKEIIMVDDFSTDGTRAILEDLKGTDGRVFYHERNMGKGAALRTGFQHVTGDYVIVQDADLEYNPEDYHRLLAPVTDEGAAVVYGSRFSGASRPENMAFSNWTANRLLTGLSNLLYGSHVTDMETCYKLFRAEIIKRISIESDRFGFEPEITAKILKQNIKIHEVPITYLGRTSEEGKKIGWGDGISAVWTILKYRFRS